jgi:hypothetical protein
MYGPGASAHNSVTANGTWTNGATLPGGTYFEIYTATLPKFVMIFNLTAQSAIEDGWLSATMEDPSVVLWADATFQANHGIWLDWRWTVPLGDTYLKNGVAVVSTGTDELDEITGFDLTEADTVTVIGGVNEKSLYFCLGSISAKEDAGSDPGYHYFVGTLVHGAP